MRITKIESKDFRAFKGVPTVIDLAPGKNPNRGRSIPIKTPTAFHHSAQGCRVGEATLGDGSKMFSNPERVAANRRADDATPLGLKNIFERIPGVARAAQPWAGRRYPAGVNVRRIQRRRRGIFVESRVPRNPSSVGAAYSAPDGAVNWFGVCFYKEAAPDGASTFHRMVNGPQSFASSRLRVNQNL